VVQIDLTKVKRPLTEALSLFIVKVYGETNKIKVLIEWKPEKNEVQK
jgi:hypothetical protein